METQKRITKIRLANDTVTIQWEETGNDRAEQHTLRSTDAPRPELYQAMDAMIPHLLELCELPDDYVTGLEVNGVTFSYPDGIMGAVLSGQKALTYAQGPLNINTPYVPSDVENDKGEVPLLTRECVEALHALAAEAHEYAAGNRAQMMLEEAV